MLQYLHTKYGFSVAILKYYILPLLAFLSMALTTEEKSEIISKYSQAKGDTGSPEIQIAILSKEIEKLQGHLGENKHDSPAKRGLLSKLAKRRRLLRYLSIHNEDRYQKIIKSLNLKK